ncbi:hypothetical protein GCM10009850_092710 [Nonomuraea monospora]|uniref:Transposase IS701-like DDE domain-containing protein n=1 Tax=Nonomuraea monospora TaxID=568818 RepID=A0ABN3CWC3_9ACTN
MLIVTDAGYDIIRLAYVLRDLPVELLGRIRSDRVLHRPASSREEFLRAHPGGGRPPKKTFSPSARVATPTIPQEKPPCRSSTSPPGTPGAVRLRL